SDVAGDAGLRAGQNVPLDLGDTEGDDAGVGGQALDGMRKLLAVGSRHVEEQDSRALPTDSVDRRPTVGGGAHNLYTVTVTQDLRKTFAIKADGCDDQNRDRARRRLLRSR